MKKLKPAEFGETVSLCISIILVLSLAGFLLYDMTTPQTPYLAVSATAGEAHKVENGDTYILPIEVVNNSPRTITFLKLKISLGEGGDEQDIEVDYLGSQAMRDVYIYVDKAYTPQQVTVKPVYYKFN